MQKYPKLIQIFETNEVLLVCNQTWDYINVISPNGFITCVSTLHGRFDFKFEKIKKHRFNDSMYSTIELMSIYDFPKYWNRYDANLKDDNNVLCIHALPRNMWETLLDYYSKKSNNVME